MGYEGLLRAGAALLALGLAAPAFAQSSAEAEARRVLSQFDNEPTVRQVQDAAVSFASMHPELYEAMHTRSRVAAVLPELKVRVTKDDDEESRVVTGTDKGSSVNAEGNTTRTEGSDVTGTETTDDNLQLYAEARWKLGELVFNPRETSVVKEGRYNAKERQRLVQTVTQLYFERRRAQVELVLAPPTDVSARTLAELKIAQLTGELDALTGAAFSRMLEGKATP